MVPNSEVGTDGMATTVKRKVHGLLAAVGRCTRRTLSSYSSILPPLFICAFLVFWFYGYILAFLLIVAISIGLFFELEDVLLYHPNEPAGARLFVSSPAMYNLPYEDIYITASDGVKLHAYLIVHQDSLVRRTPTVVIFHGNAGNIGYMLPVAVGFFHHVHVNVLLLEYRGYGKSEGTPCESGLYLDGMAALRYVKSLPTLIDPTRIVLFGSSLGGAIALRTAAECDAAALFLVIVENSFTSLPAIGRLLVGYGPLKWLPDWCFKNQYQSCKLVRSINSPVLFLSALDDTLVPPAMVEELRSNCSSRHCFIVKLPGVGHNDAHCAHGYWSVIRDCLSFLTSSG